ncbi:hypothetical protein F0562_029473 [Nyssa sinensis]|uniref:Uncharacterized protein n=1 Tax=Nyssa sinensis TaxID=561372 RepID=A0A5J5B156_9ASTE|nr:hypothetical protein F0562_029473 [Nyssa sinensis]
MADVKSRVNVHSKTTVVSSKPIGPGKVHRFSALDHATGLHTLHIIFYYRTNPFHGSNYSFLDSFWVSLSEVLCLYPQSTGRLHRGEDGNWFVKCNDAGVRMLRATVGATLDEWLRSADATEERDLTVWEDMPDEPDIWSPFRIQINDFEGGGVAIGLSCTHMHADPTCATTLIKSWAEVHQGVPLAHPPLTLPLAPRRCLSPNTDTKSIKYYATKSKAETVSVKMATATFSFPDSAIKQRLIEVHEKCPDANPFDFLAALFWMRVVRLKEPTHDHTSSLSICTDFRKLMDAPLPYGYFGNALHFSLLSLDSEILDNGRLGHVVEMVHNHVAGLAEEEFWSAIDGLESQKEEMGQYAAPFRMYGPELTCVNMEHMIIPTGANESSSYQSLMYAAMFKKDEKPFHVTYHVGNVEGEGLILVVPSPEKGLSRRVTVTLPEEQIAKLCEDQALLDLEPTMLISGRK